MAVSKDSPITPQRWISNLIEVAEVIADRSKQEERWRNGNRNIWEHPVELICTVDDYVLDGFIEAFSATFTPSQGLAIRKFQDQFEMYCSTSPQRLNPIEVLDDPRWELVRLSADDLVAEFKGRWPEPASAEAANRLLQAWMKAYADKLKK